mmetsp:Transcript_47850/g.113700  ORF Transcript_47850/g.113700 Transcript_47850/m.113700 type:complete len:464 (-) Transcript_47850:181-1572(-)|eukprot:CAMPEP_0178389282 /NCGR_PEP_ID=MMETSP0689_2-20121128/10034_1 /TAXON_ID=160604 /ORGANISM="Amphidinium massartii, Strain CS-259" /LENGTH=463 /DNA_ID=CAMNT_0020009723 /DNA_START=6 /DNA_END=1397 /DNA_ORIENTATION=+
MAETQPLARYVAEFVGTLLLVFTVGCNVLTEQGVFGGVSIACVLMVMIYALGKSSGGNFNPAVSIALGLAQKMDWIEVCIYVVVQILAGVFGGLAYYGMFGKSFNLEPTTDHTWWQAGLAEMLYTFMLCFVVLNTAASKVHGGRNQFYGLAIGFVVVAGAYSGGSISMGCFNPAVAFGIDVSSASLGIKYCFLYTLFELAGAALAAGLFVVCRPEEMDLSSIPAWTSKLVSEFLGTYMLVLTVGLNVLSGSAAAAFSIAAALMCMIFALGTVSGAHFNPAVTVAILFSRHTPLTPKDALAYMGTQIVAGWSAALTYGLLMNGKSFPLYSGDYGWHQALEAELVFTFILSFVVLSVATGKSPLSEYFGFAIGMCVTVGGFAIGKVSGGSLNPAVSFGIATSHAILAKEGGFWHCIVYSLIEIAAAVLASSVFFLTQPSEFKEVSPLTDALGDALFSYGTTKSAP